LLTPDWTLPVAAAVFLTTLFILNRVLFRPLFQVLAERGARTTQVSGRVQEILDQHQTLYEQYQQKLAEERQAGYKLAESVRTEALKEGNNRVAQARRQAEALLANARSEIEADLDSAKRQLTREAEDTARILADRILGRA
jgi:F-type H+-transporting ATPase subunit b